MQISPSRRKGVSGGKDVRTGENGSAKKEEGNEAKKNGENMEEERGSLEDFVLESFESEELPLSDYNTLGLIRSGKVLVMLAHVSLHF